MKSLDRAEGAGQVELARLHQLIRKHGWDHLREKS
jgi:hypothetical protein